MFKQLKDFFEGTVTLELDHRGHLTHDDVKIATGVLLLQMAGADYDYDEREIQKIFDLMNKQFSLEDPQTGQLLEIAEGLRKNNNKISDFVIVIKDSFDEKQRQMILAMMWKVAMADDSINRYEKILSSQMQDSLNLTAELANEAKVMAETNQIELT